MVTSSFNHLSSAFLLYNEVNLKEGWSNVHDILMFYLLACLKDEAYNKLCVFSTCGEGLDLQLDGSWYLWLGLRLFHVFLPKENSPESRKVILPALEYARRYRRWCKTNTRGADGSFSLSLSLFTATSCSMFADLVSWDCCSVPGWVTNFMMDLIVLAASALGMMQPEGRETRHGGKEWPFLPHQESVEDLKTKIPAVFNSLLLE